MVQAKDKYWEMHFDNHHDLRENTLCKLPKAYRLWKRIFFRFQMFSTSLHGKIVWNHRLNYLRPVRWLFVWRVPWTCCSSHIIDTWQSNMNLLQFSWMYKCSHDNFALSDRRMDQLGTDALQFETWLIAEESMLKFPPKTSTIQQRHSL